MLRWNSIPAQRTKGWKLEWNVQAFYDSVFLIFFSSWTFGSWTCTNPMLQKRKTSASKTYKDIVRSYLIITICKIALHSSSDAVIFTFFKIYFEPSPFWPWDFYKSMHTRKTNRAISSELPLSCNSKQSFKKCILVLVCNLNQPGCNCRL